MLTTLLAICEPTNPELVFLKARQAIGIPAEHPFEEDSGYRRGSARIVSQPAGFDAALKVHTNAGRALLPHPDEAHNWPSEVLVLVQFDSCGGDYRALHDRLVIELGESLSILGVYEWYAFDELNDVWHFRAAPHRKEPTA